jgi:hypothetical protein
MVYIIEEMRLSPGKSQGLESLLGRIDTYFQSLGVPDSASTYEKSKIITKIGEDRKHGFWEAVIPHIARKLGSESFFLKII